MEFDIFNHKPRQVVCVKNQLDGMSVNSIYAHLLEVGNVYTVTDVAVHDWYTVVYLKEFPNHRFNSVQFAEIG